MTEVRIIKISNDDDGQRLDRWIKRAAPDLPYGLVQKLIRKGGIRINGKRAKADQKLEKGQEVRLPPSEKKAPVKKKKLSDADRDFIKSLVIYEDDYVIALNKTHGLATQGGTNTERHIDGMLEAFMDHEGTKPKLVHRLDKDTSGVLLLAKNTKAAQEMGRIFKGKEIRKIYWALVSPVPQIYEGTISAPLKKAGGTNRERMRVDEEEGKYAVTDYSVIETANTEAAFVAFWPHTGRTHQIRAHAEVMNCPIIGDPKYKRREIVHEHEVVDLSALPLADRLHLHAFKISCPHPSGKGVLDVSAPLAPELRKSWQELGFDPDYNEEPFDG